MSLMPENVNYQITAVSVIIYGNHCILPNRVYTLPKEIVGLCRANHKKSLPPSCPPPFYKDKPRISLDF